MDSLLDRCAELVQYDRWEFDIEKAIDEILRTKQKDELAINRNTVRSIITHLRAGKNVILVGPPGVGKTDLAQQIMTVVGKRITGRDYEVAVASDEWSRFLTVRGIDFDNRFQEGYVTKAAKEGKWLLIDEFNRANMNKAFGDMFMAVEYGEIKFRPHERALYAESTKIPSSFRMICTMNDFDKNLLLSELSYGLISRFAFVSIRPDLAKEREVVAKRVKADLIDSKVYDKCIVQLNAYFDFIKEVRKERMIGVRTSLDVARYLISAAGHGADDSVRWKSLNDAIVDYVLPQFDRLDSKTLEHVLNAANEHLKDDEAFQQFKSDLNDMLQKLRRTSAWLSKDDS